MPAIKFRGSWLDFLRYDSHAFSASSQTIADVSTWSATNSLSSSDSLSFLKQHFPPFGSYTMAVITEIWPKKCVCDPAQVTAARYRN